MRRYLVISVGLLAILAWACTTIALGQLNPFETGGAEKPLLESSPTGGIPTSTYMNRARAVAQPQPPAAQPRGATATNYIEGGAAMGGPPAAAGAGAAQPSQWVAAPAPGQGPTPTPTPVMVTVIGGNRVRCAVCGALLEDVRKGQVPEIEAKTKYYDDGTHGDVEAGDGEYTNIVEIDHKYIGPECNAVKERLLSLLRYCEDTDSLHFFGLYATTTEPISQITKERYEEQERDAKLKEWEERFLRMFRKNPDDPTSDFYPLYVPLPPEKPTVPIPPGFDPILAEKQREEQQQQQQQQIAGGGRSWRGARGGGVVGGPAGGGGGGGGGSMSNYLR
jgi:uncharacterized membrane protein YgcG